MITGEIKLYDEPLPAWNTHVHTKIATETPEERAAWLERCAADLDKAKQMYSVGDKVFTKSNKISSVVVINFIEQLERMQKYHGNPCVMECKSSTYTSGQPIQYSLDELDFVTLIKKDTPNV